MSEKLINDTQDYTSDFKQLLSEFKEQLQKSSESSSDDEKPLEFKVSFSNLHLISYFYYVIEKKNHIKV